MKSRFWLIWQKIGGKISNNQQKNWKFDNVLASASQATLKDTEPLIKNSGCYHYFFGHSAS
jgi:hypothetical protein